ncbi:hypothetical protein TIFTF001_015755 [Ficus carica]|uniref:Uncharacterized protein n=1 Tax=Ficus carica TaxID=3494 RepID=A0AA88A918_FICCA|nr:hypothetical protein TIFTF001_015755 [Ficus carica]
MENILSRLPHQVTPKLQVRLKAMATIELRNNTSKFTFNTESIDFTVQNRDPNTKLLLQLSCKYRHPHSSSSSRLRCSPNHNVEPRRFAKILGASNGLVCLATKKGEIFVWLWQQQIPRRLQARDGVYRCRWLLDEF